MKPIEIPFKPTYVKNNGTWVLNLKDIPLPPEFNIAEQSIISIPPKQIGGNHKHPRTEAFVGIGEDLELHWLDEKGSEQKQSMSAKNELKVFIIQPNLAHTVVNNGDLPAILIEIANAPQHKVEAVPVV